MLRRVQDMEDDSAFGGGVRGVKLSSPRRLEGDQEQRCALMTRGC